MNKKENYIPKGVRVSPKHWDAITEIAEAEDKRKSAVLRECLGLGIAYYKARNKSVFIGSDRLTPEAE